MSIDNPQAPEPTFGHGQVMILRDVSVTTVESDDETEHPKG